MDKKNIIVVVGILYCMGGIGAGIRTMNQMQDTNEKVVSMERMESQEVQIDQSEQMQAESEKEEVEIETEMEIETEIETEIVEQEEKEEEVIVKKEEDSKVETDSEQEALTKDYIAVVTKVGKRRLNIRKQPSMSARVVGSMVLNDEAKVIEVGEEWHLIEFNDIRGYIFARYAELVEIPNNGTS